MNRHWASEWLPFPIDETFGGSTASIKAIREHTRGHGVLRDSDSVLAQYRLPWTVDQSEADDADGRSPRFSATEAGANARRQLDCGFLAGCNIAIEAKPTYSSKLKMRGMCK